MQNDCFGMNGLLWQYHHDHILKGRFFGRVDVCECAWCDCFFPVLHVLWLRRPQEMSRDPSGFKLSFSQLWDLRTLVFMTRGPSRFKLSFSRLWDLQTLVFIEMCFVSWHVTPMSGNRISIHGTNRKHEQYLRVRSGEVVFYVIVHVVINTTSTLCSFICTKLICYVHA